MRKYSASASLLTLKKRLIKLHLMLITQENDESPEGNARDKIIIHLMKHPSASHRLSCYFSNLIVAHELALLILLYFV